MTAESRLKWQQDGDLLTATEIAAGYEIGPDSGGWFLRIHDFFGRDLIELKVYQLIESAKQDAEDFSFRSYFGRGRNEKHNERNIWGRRRTKWIRHYAPVNNRNAMLLYMEFTNYRPDRICGASLPLFFDPFLLLLSQEDVKAADEVGDRVCKRCLAHLGLDKISNL